MADSVLIIDATPMSRMLAEHLITGMGCRCTTVDSSARAASELGDLKPLLTFADCRTLWGDVGAARALLQAHQEGASGPLILVAGTDTPTELLEEAWRAGANDCIMHPLRANHVLARIQAAREGAGSSTAAPRPEAPLVVLAGSGLERLRRHLELSGYQTAMSPSPLRLPAATLATRVDVLVCAPTASNDNVPFLLRQVRGMRGSLERAPALLLTHATLPPDEKASLNVTACLPPDSAPETVVRHLNILLSRNQSELGVKSRAPFFCPVEFREGSNGAGDWSSGFSYDLSPDGIFIQTLVPPRPGAALELKLHLTLLRQQIAGTGLVCWANPYRRRHAFSYPVGMGVKFLGMSTSELMTLRSLCQSASNP